MTKHSNFIAGKWMAPREGGYYQICNPARPREALGEFPVSGAPDADAALTAAEAALPSWSAMPGPQRGAILFRFAELLEQAKSELGRIITLEQGKALAEATGEVGRAAVEARFMAGEASRTTGQTFPSERPGFTCSTILEPLGVVAAICPWNFPVVTPVRKLAPALAYGNTAILKPASLTPWSSVYLFDLLEKAGLPPGVANLVIGPGRAAGEAILTDDRVRGITFTGSTSVGLRIYEAAARRMARVQLELGGKNPAIVFDHDDLDGAAREIVSAAFLCSGQRCTALSRVIVSAAQADALVERLMFHIGRINVGDGLAEGTTMGPLVSRSQLETVAGYVQLGKESGCTLLFGGRTLTDDPDNDGYFHEPTLFDWVPPDSPLAQDEIFGPVLPVIRATTIEEAIRAANGTRYGLAASVFTARLSHVNEFASRIQSGMIHINHGTASQAHIPFGGVKDSGQGAYSIGPTAREFFTNIKSVYVKW